MGNFKRELPGHRRGALEVRDPVAIHDDAPQRRIWGEHTAIALSKATGAEQAQAVNRSTDLRKLRFAVSMVGLTAQRSTDGALTVATLG